MRKYLKDMNILRGIGITLVLLGHSFPDNGNYVFNNNSFYKFLHIFIYSFHMPLFFFVSGFFAFKIYKITSLKDYKSHIFSKFKRLMIPYFLVTMMAIPLKLFLNKYSLRPMNLSTIILNIFFYPLENPIIFFWFIYTLFIIFAILPLLNKLDIKITLLISFIIYMIPINITTNPFNINGVCHYLVYFCLGLFFNINVYSYYQNMGYKKIICLISTTLLILLNLLNYSFYYTNFLISFITAISGIITFINLSYIVKDNTIGNFFEVLGKYSFDIYLYSWFFQSAARVIFVQLIPLNYNLVVFLMLIFGTAPILFSKFLLRKNKVTRKFLLGIY